MDDLISRQAAIDEANAWLLDCFNVGKQDRSCGLIRRLEDLPSAQRWIPCSEKLPELNLSVLVQLNDGFADPIQIMTLNISKSEGDFFCFWRTQEMGIDFDMDDVVAWMPLPAPWKGEDHESD